MKLQSVMSIAAMALVSTALTAQVQYSADTIAFQQFGGTVGVRIMAGEGAVGRTTTGKPLSAAEERRTLQVLADGTRIEHTDSNIFLRDEQGRTRTEHGQANAASVTIQDPVGGFMLMLNPANKTAQKVPMPTGTFTLPAPHPLEGAGMNVKQRVMIVGGASNTISHSGPQQDVLFSHIETMTAAPQVSTEELGTQLVNGVMAKGKRTTMTIPTGQIGNDRPIQVVSEVWTSDDLQMIVKSSNKDPRFGDTTYQLTNIVRGAPPAAMFQIPSDYTVQEGR